MKVRPARSGWLVERLAHDAAAPGDVVEDAGGEARVADAVGEEAPGPRRVGRALEDDRVAGDERRGHGAAGEGEGEVEGRDHRPHAVGLEDGAVVGAVAGERVVGQDVVVVPVPLVLRGVAGEEVGRLLGLAERLHAVLADLQGEGGADRVDALLEERRDAPARGARARRAASRASRRRRPSPPPRRGPRRRARRGGSGRARAAGPRGCASRTCCAAATSRPPTCIACVAPRAARTSASAASKRACISSGGSNIVEYVSLKVMTTPGRTRRRSRRASALQRSSSRMTRGGARRTRLPRTANETPSSRPFLTRASREGWVRGQAETGSRVVRSFTSSTTAKRPCPPRTSPMTGSRSCMARSSASIRAPRARDRSTRPSSS